jgi:hypothetical protein
VVRLAEVDDAAQHRRALVARLLDVAERGAAVEGGLAHAEQVEVGAVEDEDRRLGHVGQGPL